MRFYKKNTEVIEYKLLICSTLGCIVLKKNAPLERKIEKEKNGDQKMKYIRVNTWTTRAALVGGMKVQRQNTFRLPSHRLHALQVRKENYRRKYGEWEMENAQRTHMKRGEERRKKMCVEFVRIRTGQGHSSPPREGHAMQSADDDDDNALFKLAKKKHPASDRITTRGRCQAKKSKKTLTQ